MADISQVTTDWTGDDAASDEPAVELLRRRVNSKLTNPLLTAISITITDDDSAATNGTAVQVGHAAGGGAAFSSANAGASGSAFLDPTGTEFWAVAHDSGASEEPVYFDEDAEAGSRLLHAGSVGYTQDFYVQGTGGRVLKVTYDADAATKGVQLYFDDDGADIAARLLFVSPTDADGSENTSTERAAAWVLGS